MDRRGPALLMALSIGRTCRLVLLTCLASLALVYCSDDDGPLPESTLEPRPARPTATATEEPPGPTFLTEEEFKALLMVEDIKPVLQEQVDLKVTQFIDLKQVLAERNVQQMFPLDSGFSIFFVDADETKSIRLGVFDMKSLVDATSQYEEVKANTEPEPEVMLPPIGNASSEMEVNAGGIGSNVIFLRGDKLVTLHTGMPDGAEALTDLAGLRELARTIDRRLSN